MLPRPATLLLVLLTFAIPNLAIGTTAESPNPPAAGSLVPSESHAHGYPTGELAPLPIIDMTHWWAIPVRQDASGNDPTTYGFLVMDFDSLGIAPSDVLGRGYTIVSFDEFGSWTDSMIAKVAVDIDDVLPLSRPASGPGGSDGSPSAAAVSGPQMIVAISYDNTADRGIANEALGQTVTFYQEKHGIALNTLATWSYAGTINGYCELQKAARQAQNQTVGAVAFVGFSNGVIGESSAASGGFGVYVGGPAATIYSRGESPNNCGSTPVTPAVLPQVFTSTGFPVNTYGGYMYAANAVFNAPTWDADKRGTAYVLAHEFGHFLSMGHNMARCWYDWWNGSHMHKTLETFTSQYVGSDAFDPPGSCADSVPRQYQNLDPDSHFHWYFNDQSGGGVGAVNAAWTRLSSCINARWCTRDASPSAPRSLSASPGNNRVTLSWVAPEFGGGNSVAAVSVKGYCVYTATSPAFTRPTSTGGDCQDSTSTSRTITGYSEDGTSRTISNGVRYYFYVRAYNGNDGWPSEPVGPRSGYADAVPVNRAPPAVTGPSPWDGQSDTSRNVVLNWGQSVDPDGDTVTYKVMAGTSHPPSAVSGCQGVADSSRQCSFSGLQAGTQYHWGVQACDSAGLCSSLPDWHFTTQATTPGAPTLNSATGGNGKITLSWSAGSTGGSAITGYRVYRGTSSGQEGATPISAGTCTDPTTTATSCEDTSVATGQTYYYKVAAVNALGTGPQSNERSASSNPTVPDPPTLNSATPGTGQVTLAWSAPSNNGGSTITDYKVFRDGTQVSSGGCSTGSLDGSSTGCTDTGLTNGQSYGYTVKAVNSVGDSGASNSRSATPFTVPGAPTLNSATPGNAQVTLAWTANSNNGGSALTTFRVFRGGTQLTSGGCASGNLNGGSTGCTDSGLTNGNSYSYTVRAVNAAGASGDSNSRSATPVTTPGAPTLNSATAGNAQVTLGWTANSNNGGSSVTTFKVFRNGAQVTSGGCSSSSLTGSSTGCTDSSLTNGQSYSYTVRAVNAAGDSGDSNSRSATPATTPGVPSYLQATGQDARVVLTWPEPSSNGGSSITGYRVYRSTSSSSDGTGLTSGGCAYPVSPTVVNFEVSCTDNTVTNGVRYYYKVAAVNAIGEGGKSSQANAMPNPPPAPTNNNFASALTGSGQSASWTGVNTGATWESSEPTSSCTGSDSPTSVWFRFTASTLGRYRITTNWAETDFDTVLDVWSYSGSGGFSGLTSNNCNDDYPNAGLKSQIDDRVIGANQQIAIRVTGYHGATGNLKVSVAYMGSCC